MKRDNKRRSVALTICILTASFGIAWVPPLPARGEVVAIANRDVTVDRLSPQEVKNIFLGKTTHWSNGQRIIPTLQDQGKVHQEFLNSSMGMTAVAFRNYWRKVIFTGEGASPRTVQSDAEMIHMVASTPGAVGYVDNQSNPQGVNVFRIIH
ncbi:MAG: substrate-binding domain-containing protein [Magnetococcales bacterium]|nr:substrate-binding domain-containing protein [Magnetococcales bacterium]